MAFALRLIKDYDALWLTLAVSASEAAAIMRTARWKTSGRREQWYMVLLLSGLVICGALGMWYWLWALGRFCCP